MNVVEINTYYQYGSTGMLFMRVRWIPAKAVLLLLLLLPPFSMTIIICILSDSAPKRTDAVFSRRLIAFHRNPLVQ